MRLKIRKIRNFFVIREGFDTLEERSKKKFM